MEDVPIDERRADLSSADPPHRGSQSPLVLGGLLFGRWGGLQSADVDRLVHEALDAGVDAFDTAAAYGGGESEVLLGRALRGRRDGVWISTKVFGPHDGREPADWRPPALRRTIDASLRRLGTDHVDVLSVHRLDDHIPIEPVLAALWEAQAQGKARWIGASSMSGDLLLEALMVAQRVGASIAYEQCKMSILDRSSEASVLPVADRHNVRPMYYGVLEEGLLVRGHAVGRFTRGVDAQPWPDAARRSLAQKREVVQLLEVVAADLRMTLRDLAIAFACQPHSAAGQEVRPDVIVGVSRPGQLSSLVSAAQTTLPSSVVDALDQIVPPGTAVGVPDRSRMRSAALTRRGQALQPLVAGDPRSSSDGAQAEVVMPRTSHS